jgi:uncharacterized protein YggU (UPF0235/DUF167 family)
LKLNKTDTLVCYVKSQAEQGKANAELLKSLAKKVGITQFMATIVSGNTSRNKRIKIDVDITYTRTFDGLELTCMLEQKEVN